VPSDPRFPRPAASIVVLRPGSGRFEVLMVKRRGGGTFENLVVFPGGTVDEADRKYTGRSAESEDEAFRAAALRELAEETNLLSVPGRLVGAPGLRDDDLYRWLAREGLSLDIGSLVLVSRWVTPRVMPYRFDTRFYILGVDETPDVVVDEDELVGHAWSTPEAALDRGDSGRWRMILPTLAHLRWLSRRESIEDAVSSARGADGRTLITPRVLEDGSLLPIHLPADS
jgi:8-oxo-dGTP pyrophosphatase MutT (NUDIX family)